jgi:cobalamin biosynthesis protein CobW
MNARIPATVITGFLGAGKTTLIRNLLQNANGLRIALIVNEFGDVGVDGSLLKGCAAEACPDDNIIELANGCICCTVADDFLPAMAALLERPQPPDHIIIETSGLALPQPLIRAFGWPDIASRVTVDAVVTVVDGKAQAEGRYADDEATIQAMRAADPNLEHENPIGELFADQLNCADLVVLNKTDLMSEAEITAVSAELSQRKRGATSLVRAAEGKVPLDVLIGRSAAAEADIQNRPSTHEMEGEEQHDHDDFVSFHVDVPAGAPRDKLMQRIESVISDPTVLRLKGYASLPGVASRLLIQAAGPRLASYFDRPWKADEDRATQLVVIGVKGIDREAVSAVLRG